jgi:multicomponent Na+:H+ antiporter subunit D
MNNSLLLLLLIALPLLAALLIGIFRRSGAWLSGLTVLALAKIVGWLYLVRPFNNIILCNKFGLALVLDGLSHLLLFTANLTAFFIILYAASYAGKYRNQPWFFALFLVMLAGINGVVLAGDLVWLFIFLELAALSAYLLVAFGNTRAQLEAAVKYLLIGEGASLLILIGCGLVHKMAGTFNMAEAAQIMAGSPANLKMAASLLFIVGFGTKAALLPFQAWLPDAHSSAPAPVSAILSGVIIKTLGIYALARILFNVLGMTPELSLVLTGLGVLSIIVAGLFAVGQSDMKRLMAYSSISQIGYITVGLALATPLALLGALFHLFNHALMKALLFLNAGAVERQTETRDLTQLGGLRQQLPVTATTSLIGSLAISGVPPFNGFWSKLFIIVACVQAGKLWVAFAAVIGSLLTMGAFLRLQKHVFFGQPHKKFFELREAPLTMSLAVAGLALLCLAVGLAFPLVIGYLINPAVVALANGTGYARMILGAMQ